MHLDRIILILSAILPALTAAPATAGDNGAQVAPVEPVAPSEKTDAWAGHYYLQGVMETGSELLLRADGRFQWYLAVGALDLFAQGRWEADEGTVTLISEPDGNMPRPGFETLVLRQEDGRLIPPAEFGRGAYIRPDRSGD